MNISEISIIPVKPSKSLVAFASCVVNHQIYIGSIAIHCDRLNNGFRCVFPTKKFRDGNEIPIYHPITKEAGEVIQRAIVKEWENYLREFM